MVFCGTRRTTVVSYNFAQSYFRLPEKSMICSLLSALPIQRRRRKFSFSCLKIDIRPLTRIRSAQWVFGSKLIGESAYKNLQGSSKINEVFPVLKRWMNCARNTATLLLSSILTKVVILQSCRLSMISTTDYQKSWSIAMKHFHKDEKSTNNRFLKKCDKGWTGSCLWMAL